MCNSEVELYSKPFAFETHANVVGGVKHVCVIQRPKSTTRVSKKGKNTSMK